MNKGIGFIGGSNAPSLYLDASASCWAHSVSQLIPSPRKRFYTGSSPFDSLDVHTNVKTLTSANAGSANLRLKNTFSPCLVDPAHDHLRLHTRHRAAAFLIIVRRHRRLAFRARPSIDRLRTWQCPLSGICSPSSSPNSTQLSRHVPAPQAPSVPPSNRASHLRATLHARSAREVYGRSFPGSSRDLCREKTRAKSDTSECVARR